MKMLALGRHVKSPFQVHQEILLGLNGVRGEEFTSFNKSQKAVVTSVPCYGWERSVGYMKYVF